MYKRQGYLSAYFVTNTEKIECEMEKPYILIYDKKISKDVYKRQADSPVFMFDTVNRPDRFQNIFYRIQGGMFSCFECQALVATKHGPVPWKRGKAWSLAASASTKSHSARS